MNHIKVQLPGKQADGYVIPLGPVNLVNVVTDVGMVGCGAFDVAALNNFGYPAAKVRPSQGSSIATIEDLLQGIVKEVNPNAEKLGLKVGLTGREALELL
ncbi:MAG TPA: YunC family protein [Methanothrix soehngenii]|nr:YunC family protein [Methanothrix soehngenii]